jgi:hypothetical protein
MHRGTGCESVKRTIVMGLSSKANSATENKPNRPGPSKDKFKKQSQPKRQCNMPYMSDSLIIPRVKQVVNVLLVSQIFQYSRSPSVQDEVMRLWYGVNSSVLLIGY